MGGLPFKVEYTVHHMLQNSGPGDGAVLVDMAHHKDRDAAALGQLHQCHGASLHLGHAAGCGGVFAVTERLDRVRDQHIRFDRLGSLQHLAEIRLTQQQEVVRGHAQPLGPELDLGLALFAGYIQHPQVPAQLRADLQQQRGLADARRTGHQHQRVLHGAAAQHPI